MFDPFGFGLNERIPAAPGLHLVHGAEIMPGADAPGLRGGMVQQAYGAGRVNIAVARKNYPETPPMRTCLLGGDFRLETVSKL